MLSNLRPVRLVTAVLAAVLVGATLSCGADGGSAGQDKVTIGVGGQPLLVYLPTTLAQRLGFYQDAGLDVHLEDLQSGSKALEALLGGSVDVVSGYYDHTIQMQAKDRDVTSFVNLLRYPSLVLAVSPKTHRTIDSVRDLKGATVGVTAPGSSTDFYLKYLLTKNGIDPQDTSVQGIGGDATAVAAMESGRVDAAVMIDPAFSLLQKRAGADNVRILSDTRTEQGVRDSFQTSTYPASVLYSTSDWMDDHHGDVGKLAKAMVRTLRWIRDHSAEQIAAKMPPEYSAGDRDVYVQAIARAKSAYSQDGVIQRDGANAVYTVLRQFIPEVADKKIDLAKTYTNDFLDATG